MVEKAKKDRKRRTISSFTILLIMLIALAIITVIMSWAGTQGVTGATVADVATAPVKGFTDALPVCLFVLILGGFLGIVTETGALDAGIAALVKKLKGNELILIPILMFIFSIGGTTYGMCEETVPFYLLLAATMVAAGFDSIVGAAVVLLGAGCGVLGSTVNPFAVGAAIDSLSSTGLVINQGVIIGLGVVLWLVTLAISIVFVMRYAKKVKADKGSTILSLQEQEVMRAEYGEAQQEAVEAEEHPHEKLMTARQKWSLVVFGLTFVVMIIGFIPWESFGIDVFDAGAATEEVTETVSGEDISATWSDDEVGGELFVRRRRDRHRDHGRTGVGRLVGVSDRAAAGAVVLRRGFHVVPHHGARHRHHRRAFGKPLRQGVHQRRRRHDERRAHHRACALHHGAHGRDRP